MSHLKKNAAGHLLFGSRGHLVNDCGAAPENECHDCDPPIPDSVYVTFADLAGDFAVLNGTWECIWSSACYWFSRDGGDNLPRAELWWAAGRWRLEAQITSGERCYKDWRPTTAEGTYNCDPLQTYAEHDCNDLLCNDRDSCADSAGATASLSYTP